MTPSFRRSSAAEPRRNDATLLTKSFSGDFELCRMLCESIDRFASEDIFHHVVVPPADIPLFSRLETPKRRIISEKTALPDWIYKIPMPSAEWRKTLRLPRRDMYLTRGGRPVRGWLVQQLIKLEATLDAPTEIVVHLDSDIVFVRRFALDCFAPGADRVRLYRRIEEHPLDTHIRWRRVARTLLGSPRAEGPQDDMFQDYIGPVLVWRRSLVQKMLEHLEAVNGKDWRAILASTPHFSEYTMYGIFVDEILGLEAAGLAPQSNELCLTRWTEDFRDAADEEQFQKSLKPDDIACCLQSTLAMTLDDRRRILDRIVEQAHAPQRLEPVHLPSS